MSADISQEAYDTYLRQYALFKQQWPNFAGHPKTYEEWADATQHRDHPRWSEYMRARRLWKASTFHITYGPEAETSPFPQFPEFEDWLEQKHDNEYFPDPGGPLGSNASVGIIDEEQDR